MDSKKYRIEKIDKNGSIRYNLIKDVRFKDKKAKVRKAISDPENVGFFCLELEKKAAFKKAELVSDYYSSDYLKKIEILSLEEKRAFRNVYFKQISPDDISLIEAGFETDYIHGTTAIEGNTFRLNEVRDLLEYGISPKKTLREINEIQNFTKTRAFANHFNGKVTVDFIKKIHSLIMDKILENPGHFRNTGIGIIGCDLQHTPPELIEDELNELINNFYENLQNKKHPFEQIIIFHYRFESIHPFTDGNGRVGREIMNYFFRKEKYPQFLIRPENRTEYLSALRMGDEEKIGQMIQIFYQIYQKQLDKDESELNRFH
jgi:Fic family protein